MLKDKLPETTPELARKSEETDSKVQWNLSYPGSVGPRGARNFKIARNSELIHELCTYSTWLYENTGHMVVHT